MTRKRFFSIVLFILSFSSVAYGQTETKVDHLNVPGPIVFDKKPYQLAWTSHPSENYYKQEYLTKGDVVNKFKTMILLEVLVGDVSVKDIVANKVSELKKMKETNPMVNYEMLQKDGEYILDFLLSSAAADGKSIAILERNVYRYKSTTVKSGQKALVLFAISSRSYGNEVDGFLRDLKSAKSKQVNEIAQFSIPQISIRK